MKNKVGIVGHGCVGKRMEELFKDHHEIRIYDLGYPDSNTKEEINKCDLAVVCVPTPMKDDKSCDISIVEESVSWLKTPVIWVRSTIAPGTTEHLKKKYKKRIVFSPEYLGQSKYWTPYDFHTDEKKMPYIIFGGDKKDTQYVIKFVAPILGPVKQYPQTDAITAEVVKYMENTFFALKVTFANEMLDICKAMGLDFYEVRDLWTMDPRINPMHTMVFEENRGFGGKCYPKDVNGIIQASKKVGYTPELLEKMVEVNEKLRKNNPTN
jgi:nucleotide sugar dehydrogenase